MRGMLYTLEELACRPIEHAIEDLPIRALGRAVGKSRQWGLEVKRGRFTLDAEQREMLRQWLERGGD